MQHKMLSLTDLVNPFAPEPPVTAVYDSPLIPWTARKNGSWSQSIRLSALVFFCLLFLQRDW